MCMIRFLIPTMTLLNSMFEGNLTVTIAPLQKQQGGSDCGVFSVAVATSLLQDLINSLCSDHI